MNKGITVAGSILVDKIYGINSYPNVGELTQIKNISIAVGGLVPNVGIDIKTIRPDIKVQALGKIGKDADGAYVKSVLTERGLVCDGITSCDDATSFTAVMSIEGGQRTFFSYGGASGKYGYDDIDYDELDTDIFHLGYFLLLDKVDRGDGLKILRELKSRGIRTSIDLVSEDSDRYRDVVCPSLPYVDYLIINEVEAGKLTGIEPTYANMRAICSSLISMGVQDRVIIHCPTYAVCMRATGEYVAVPSLKIPDGFIKGTTGAGDAFCAGCLVSIYEGLDDVACLNFASMSAVSALSSADATSGMRSKEEIIKLCKNMPRRQLC